MNRAAIVTKLLFLRFPLVNLIFPKCETAQFWPGSSVALQPFWPGGSVSPSAIRIMVAMCLCHGTIPREGLTQERRRRASVILCKWFYSSYENDVFGSFDEAFV